MKVFLYDTMSEPQFWLSVILTASINLLLFYAYKAYYFLIRYPEFNEDRYKKWWNQNLGNGFSQDYDDLALFYIRVFTLLLYILLTHSFQLYSY
jgi:hypothetical protein